MSESCQNHSWEDGERKVIYVKENLVTSRLKTGRIIQDPLLLDPYFFIKQGPGLSSFVRAKS